MYNGYQYAVIKIGDSIITDIDDITEFCSEMCVDISNDETDNVEEVEEFSEFNLGYEIDLSNDDNVDSESIGLFSEFLNKNGYDKYSNTLLINGNRIDAGELNFKENRNKFNKIFEECQYDINNDTLVINSDKLKISIDSIFPDELMSSSDLTAEQYLDSYIKAGELIEEQFSDDNFFTEGVFEAIGKGLKAIWDFIVKCIKFIGRQIARFFKFIKSLFTGNKEKSLVSAEQCLQDSGVNIDNSKVSDAVNFINNPQNSKNVTVVSKKTDDVIVRVQSSAKQTPNSAKQTPKDYIKQDYIKYEDIELILRDFDYILDNDKNIVKCIKNEERFENKHVDSAGKEIVSPESGAIKKMDKARYPDMAINILSGGKIRFNQMMLTWDQIYKGISDLCDVIDNIIRTKQVPSNFSIIMTRFEVYGSISKADIENADIQTGIAYNISYNEANELSRQITMISEKMDNIKFSDIDKIISQKDYNMLSKCSNSISNLLNNICMSVNAFTNEFKSLWLVNGKHKSCVNNVEYAAKILKHFLEKGLPGKYIRQNMWILLSNEINNSNIPPAWGQSRTVFFSGDGKFVYKYAMNGFGIQSNNSEIKISKAFDNYPKERDHLIAPIIKSWGSYIVEQNCLKAGMCDNDNEDEYKTKLKKFFDDHPEWKYDFSNDMHTGNIAFNDNGETIGIDYGWVGKVTNGVNVNAN